MFVKRQYETKQNCMQFYIDILHIRSIHIHVCHAMLESTKNEFDLTFILFKYFRSYHIGSIARGISLNGCAR